MLRLLIDTDPGIDDALALFLALASPDVQLEAVTTVSGNVHVDFTTRNALTLLELAGRPDIPVARGSDRPLVRQPVIADYVHGQNGLGGVMLPDPQRQAVSNAVDVIIQKILEVPGEITLVAIGPLTNLALAVRREPRIAEAAREVMIMGGALRVPGNVTPASEFNIFADPHAAHIVLHAGWPVRLVSLDVTNHADMRREQFAALAARGHPVTQCMKRMADYHLDEFGKARGITAFHMHDPLCLAAAIQPDLIEWKAAYVDVELSGTLTLGETVAYFETMADIDPALAHPRHPNVLTSVGVDVERFIAMYMERIGNAFS
ncbi:MAG TPA: nucleoside hydrolase [Ktedonobacteraceae bacterium]|nr:nucleoside hydrolase [Ktedonobacteraceae bacterium]